MTNPLITKDLVEKLVHKDTDFVVFELTEALGKRDVSKAIKLLSVMVKEQGTLGLITNHFRRLFFISISDLDNARLAQHVGRKRICHCQTKRTTSQFFKDATEKNLCTFGRGGLQNQKWANAQRKRFILSCFFNSLHNIIFSKVVHGENCRRATFYFYNFRQRWVRNDIIILWILFHKFYTDFAFLFQEC